jgi:small subunit ribosomal protein S30e
MPTHGSLTKAGKVRAQTPKIEPTPKTRLAPKRKTRSNYTKRVVHAPRDDRRGGNRRPNF